MLRASKSGKDKRASAVTDSEVTGTSEVESTMSPNRAEKKKSKKKKAKSLSSSTDSGVSDVSPESKNHKRKKSKSKDRKKSKKSTRKENDSIEASTGAPQHLARDDILLSDGEASIQDGKSAATLEDDINDEDDLDMDGNPPMYESGPPIGEILACPTDGDDVSDIGEDVLKDPPTTEIIDGVQIFYNPADLDICFDDRYHPGTMDWIAAIRECLDRFQDQDYSPPVYRAIKKQLKGRKFFLRARSTERTSWREATKPEIIELFGEAFNEQRRRVLEGISDDDDSGVDSSLQNSAAQSVASLSEDAAPPPRKSDNQAPLPTPTSGPTPRASNQEGATTKPSSPYDFGADGEYDSEHKNRTKSESKTRSDKHLLHAMREIEVAEEYARPFDDVALLQNGIAAEEKMNMLIHLSNTSRTVALKAELEKLEELAKRMKIASLAPLLDILTKTERHVTDYCNSMADMHESSWSLKISANELTNQAQGDPGQAHRKKSKATDLPGKPNRSIEDDPRSDVDTDKEPSYSHDGGYHRRTINMSSHHGKHERSKSSHLSGTSSSPSKSKSRSGSREDQMNDRFTVNQSVLSLYDEFGEEVTSAQPNTASTEDVNSVSTEGHERMNSQAHLEDIGESSDDGNDNYGQGRKSLERSVHSSYQDPSFHKSDHAASSVATGGDRQRSAASDAEDSASEHLPHRPYNRKGDCHGYEHSVRTADFGGSFREMALDGGYETNDDMGTTTHEYGDSGLFSHPENAECSDIDYEEDYEVEYEVEAADEDTSLNVEEGQVLDLQSDDDELSSMGRSAPGLYGSDSESEEVDAECDDGVGDSMERDLDDDKDSDFSDSSSDDHHVERSERGEKKEKPNSKVDQFFHRLKHFFEVRKKIDERADLIDPLSKLSGLKVKVHSDGIQKKNGKFKKEYQQRNLKGKVVRNLDDLFGPAKLAREELLRLLSLLAGEIKGLDRGSYVVLPLKQSNKAFDKAQEEYAHRSPGPPESWLYDVVRASIYCKSHKQIADVCKWIGRNTHIVHSKNRFSEPCFNGYRDIIFHVSIPFKDDMAHICEIQVHHKDMKALDEQFGMPKHYEYFRSAFAGHWRPEALILEDLAMLNKYGEIGGQCMVKLLKSKAPDQLRLFARLCRDRLDEFDRALELYRRILLLQDAAGNDDNDDVADTYLGLGMVLGALGEVDESLLNLERALAIKESLLGTEHLEVASTYSKIGDMLRRKGEYQGALKKYRDALNVRESNLGKEHVLVIRSLQDIGNALRETGEFKASEDALQRALSIQEAVLGASDVDVAGTRSMIGVTLCEFGDYSRAMEEHRQALEIYETKVGKNNALTADSHIKIGNVLCQKGQYETAEWRYRKALRIHEAVSGKDAEACAICLAHLGAVLMRKGDDDGAIKALKRACKIREDHLGMDHPISAGSHLDLGKVYVNKRKYDQALEESRKAKVVMESFLGPLHPDTAEAYNYVGNALSLREAHEVAIAEHRQALSIYEAVLGGNHPRTATGYQFLADALLAKGDKDEALNEHRRALAVRASVLNKNHPDTALSCFRVGALLSEKGDLVGALVAYRQALAITVDVCGDDHPETATAHIEVVKLVAAGGDAAEAKVGAEHALKVREATLGKDHPETGRAYGILGTVYSMMGNQAKAAELYKRSVLILERKLGKKHPSTKAARHRLEAVDKPEDDNILGIY